MTQPAHDYLSLLEQSGIEIEENGAGGGLVLAFKNTSTGANGHAPNTDPDPETARDRVNRLMAAMFAQQAQQEQILAPDASKKADLERLMGQNEVDFLEEISYVFAPETTMLAGPAVPSPEHNPTLKPESLAYQVFKGETLIHDTAVEADRTFTGLLLYRAVRIFQKQKPAAFPNLSDAEYADLVTFTNNIVDTEHDEEIMLYALAAQDLGKTLEIMKHHTTRFSEAARDHDHLLFELTRTHPELFEGFQKLPAQSQQRYLEGLDGDLNLGQMVQGENLPCNLSKMMGLDAKTRSIRLLTELYDFAGATGHVKPGISILLNSDNLFAYKASIDALQQNDALSAYASYMTLRGQKTGLIKVGDDIKSDSDKFALCRLAALSRAFDEEKGEAIHKAWMDMPRAEREYLAYEMSLTGLDPNAQRGVLIYYSPGMMTNAIIATNSFEEGVALSLKALCNVYRSARKIVSENGLGQTTMDINNLAVLAKNDPHAIAHSFPAQPEGPFTRLTLKM